MLVRPLTASARPATATVSLRQSTPSPSTVPAVPTGPFADRAARLATEFQTLAVEAAVFVAVVAAIYLPGRYLLVPLARALMDRAGVADTYEFSLLRVLQAGVAAFALVVGANLSGLASFLEATEAVVAAATIALGFAAQDVLGNVVSGAFIVLDPEFEIGDWIRWNDREGIIEDISFRVTRVHTFDNELVTVPNGELTGAVVTNPAAKDELRVTYTFGVGYGADLDRAREIAVRIAREDDRIMDRPAPVAQVLELGASAVQLQTRFWIADPARTDFLHIRSTYVERVMDAYEAAGIDLPYPTRALTGELATRPATTPDARPGAGEGPTPNVDGEPDAGRGDGE